MRHFLNIDDPYITLQAVCDLLYRFDQFLNSRILLIYIPMRAVFIFLEIPAFSVFAIVTFQKCFGNKSLMMWKTAITYNCLFLTILVPPFINLALMYSPLLLSKMLHMLIICLHSVFNAPPSVTDTSSSVPPRTRFRSWSCSRIRKPP